MSVLVHATLMYLLPKSEAGIVRKSETQLLRLQSTLYTLIHHHVHSQTNIHEVNYTLKHGASHSVINANCHAEKRPSVLTWLWIQIKQGRQIHKHVPEIHKQHGACREKYVSVLFLTIAEHLSVRAIRAHRAHTAVISDMTTQWWTEASQTILMAPKPFWTDYTTEKCLQNVF